MRAEQGVFHTDTASTHVQQIETLLVIRWRLGIGLVVRARDRPARLASAATFGFALRFGLALGLRLRAGLGFGRRFGRLAIADVAQIQPEERAGRLSLS